MQATAPIDQLILAAESAARAGNKRESAQIWARVLELAPEEPRALNALGNWALQQGDVRRARALLRRAVAQAPNEPAVHFNLALACRADGDLNEAIRHFDRALVADPYFVQAMYQKGLALEASGQMREAALTYKDLLDCAPPSVLRSAAFAGVLAHAREVVRRNDLELEKVIWQTIERSEPQSEAPSMRVTECIAALVGKDRIYVQKPTFLHVPRLPALPFFERSLAPWLERLEEAYAQIRAELEALVEHSSAGFVPYIQLAPGQPQNQWGQLDRSPDWSAFFFWRHGQPVDDNCKLCPQTAALLEDLPMARIARRSPNAFFSLLRPRTRIPPHTGVTNMRSVVHLPLIVPDGCGFRVGPQTRRWIEGQAWMFDDTIEHEAWNDSAKPRFVLIFDVWNPLLTPEECRHLSSVIEAIDAYYGRAPGWQDEP